MASISRKCTWKADVFLFFLLELLWDHNKCPFLKTFYWKCANWTGNAYVEQYPTLHVIIGAVYHFPKAYCSFCISKRYRMTQIPKKNTGNENKPSIYAPKHRLHWFLMHRGKDSHRDAGAYNTMSSEFVHFPPAVMTELTTRFSHGQTLMSPLHCGAGWVMVKTFTGRYVMVAHLETTFPALLLLLSSSLDHLSPPPPPPHPPPPPCFCSVSVCLSVYLLFSMSLRKFFHLPRLSFPSSSSWSQSFFLLFLPFFPSFPLNVINQLFHIPFHLFLYIYLLRW